MAKGTPRTATAASAILRQAETLETEPMAKAAAAKAHEAIADKPAYKPATSGVKAGLREGETRITCIFREDQSQVLHDWAKTTGRTFREVCIAMADAYIENTIRPATSGNRKLNNTGTVPEAYADMYDAETPDEWAQFFK